MPKKEDSKAEDKPFTIIYEDDSVIAVNKASGIAVIGERWDIHAPRLDLLLKEELKGRTENGGMAELFTVHRIDKETSGLVVFAKNSKAHKELSAAFESRQIEKIYIAVIHGRPSWPGGKITCDLPLTADGNKKHLTIIDKYRGKPCFTSFSLLFSAGNYSVAEARPETGRTHQIRVHMAAVGHPVVGDARYGTSDRRLGPGRFFLHAFHLAFDHPVNGSHMELSSALPLDLEEFLRDS